MAEVDFNESLVVFARNVALYNRLSIVSIPLKGDTIDVLSMDNRSVPPIKGSATMAVAVIPREGIKNIQVGNKNIPVLDKP